ncbi:DeoR family transcriptional regulator [Thermoflavifilum aggregans]|uniref:DeoR family transcriptional regulator n=1 Tax=Thermoflavifilum aggregans TaxID=454188 RepID=A0A2M9CRD1_9BACT|nr:DeoR/GlpR family DNA-binding transcription regulator [Thermoflavifilum aggregans]PJJ74447.1 DeoR family transcriptional regulator [Thermoflavifilum aggregans]
MARKNSIQPEVRKKMILKHLDKYESISIKETARLCTVSEITARRDLDELESEGLLIRSFGVAVKSKLIPYLFSYENKIAHNRKKKVEIARVASSFVNDNDILFLGCGTTVVHLPKFITGLQNLSIITNSLPAVSELVHYPNIRINLLGGDLDHERKACYGPATEKIIQAYKANKAFLGAASISLRNGLSSNVEKEWTIARLMAESAEQVFVFCDSSKIEKDA